MGGWTEAQPEPRRHSCCAFGGWVSARPVFGSETTGPATVQLSRSRCQPAGHGAARGVPSTDPRPPGGGCPPPRPLLVVVTALGLLGSDLALRNCLLTADLTVKIGDYGLSHCKYKVRLVWERRGLGASLGPHGTHTYTCTERRAALSPATPAAHTVPLRSCAGAAPWPLGFAGAVGVGAAAPQTTLPGTLCPRTRLYPRAGSSR